MADWDFYKTNINEKIASVFLNLEAESDLTIGFYPKLCWLFIRLHVERVDGLSHDNEFDALLNYEALLLKHLEEKPIKLVGCITTNGMRQFYFYSNIGFEFKKYAEVFASTQAAYQYQLGEKLDPDWAQYKNVLYPGKFGLEQINRRRENA